ncbi:MAG: alpha/beta hydrolase [Myxococcota bacterium]
MALVHRDVVTNGIHMHVAEQGAGPPVILLHGWPESWFCWRHQLPSLARAGFRVVAPDLRGFGDTDAPDDVTQYGVHTLVADVTGMMDALHIDGAVVVGHDLGGYLAWHLALLAPERVRAVVSLNTPWRGRGLFRPTAEFRRDPTGRFNYILEFQVPEVPERQLMSDVGASLDRVVELVAHHKEFWTPEVRQAYVQSFQRGRMRCLHWYRNLDRNWAETSSLAGRTVTQPALMITAEHDPVLTPSSAAGMERHVPNLTVKLVRDCGHFTQQEKPVVVNRLLRAFLRQVYSR